MIEIKSTLLPHTFIDMSVLRMRGCFLGHALPHIKSAPLSHELSGSGSHEGEQPRTQVPEPNQTRGTRVSCCKPLGLRLPTLKNSQQGTLLFPRKPRGESPTALQGSGRFLTKPKGRRTLPNAENREVRFELGWELGKLNADESETDICILPPLVQSHQLMLTACNDAAPTPVRETRTCFGNEGGPNSNKSSPLIRKTCAARAFPPVSRPGNTFSLSNLPIP